MVTRRECYRAALLILDIQHNARCISLLTELSGGREAERDRVFLYAAMKL